MNKKPKIVFLSRYQGVVNRGVERVVRDLVRVLRTDFEVDVLSGKEADSWSKVRRGKYDVVIPVNGRWQALKMSWLRFFGGYKVLITGHSGLGIDDLWNLVVVRPNLFVSLTKSTLSHWKMKLARIIAIGVKVTMIPNGVDLKVFMASGPKAKVDLPQPVVICVGALTPEKRQKLAIMAMSRLAYGSLLIVGKGQEQSELMRLGNQLLKDRFQIMEAEFDELPSLYRAAKLFTLPSWDREAFGVVYLEAMASGLGVVAPDDALRKEIIGKAGVLVNVDDIDKYARAIDLALKQEWKTLAANQVNKFAWLEIGERYQQVILQLVK